MLRKPLLLFTTLILLSLALSAEEAVQRQLVVKKLTDHRWQRVRHQGAYFAAEVTTWEFYESGDFRWSFTSDYSDSYAGVWAISEASPNTGIIFLASTGNRVRPSRSHVLSFEFLDSGLRLGEELYQEVAFAERDVTPHVREEDRATVEPIQRERFFGLWITMTASNWRSEAAPSPGNPAIYSFSSEGNYTAQFVTPECQYSGTWSLFTSGENTNEIRLTVPANQCDTRGPTTEAFIREIPVVLEDNKLFLYKTAYASSPK